MKKTSLVLLLLLLTQISWAQYKPVEQGSTLKFTIKNLGFGVDGSFTGFDGTINFDPQNLASSNFDVTINAATVNTDIKMRDESLRGDSYFDVKNYLRIRLSSAKVAATSKSGVYMLTGQLTIKGKSGPVAFPFTVVPSTDGYIFKGSFKMKRKDFNIGGTSTISDDLEVMLNVLAKKA